MCWRSKEKKEKIRGRLLSNGLHNKRKKKKKKTVRVSLSNGLWESGAAREATGPVVGSDGFEALTLLITSLLLFSVPLLIAFHASLQP